MARPRKGLPPHVKRVRSKGRTYYYFDTGKVKEGGQPIYSRLPDIADKAGFGGSYASLLAHRTRSASKAPELTVAALVDRYQRSREYLALTESTRSTYNVYLLLLERKIGNAPAGDVARRDVLALLDTMADRTGAANMTLNVVKAVYAWGRDRELVTIDPAADISLFAKRDYEPWPEPLLAEALLSEDAFIRRLVALLYFTAQRIGDVSRMRWSHIDGDVLAVTQKKTGKSLEIPLHPDLALNLGARPNSDAPLIATDSGGHYRISSLRERLQRWAGDRGHKVVPHGLRKNAVNALLEAGCSAAETAAVSGQSLGMVEHYAKRRSTSRLARTAITRLARAKGEQENIGKLP